MDALATATATATAVSAIGSHFMLDGKTYARGAELGFAGLDFYVGGRGGVLGEVDADVVTAAFAFFAPDHIRAQWESANAVMPATDAADHFAACCAAWADQHVPEDLDAARLAELATIAVTSARAACAPTFAAWRAVPVPTDPRQAAVHQLNVLRELRLGLHAAAVIGEGLSPLEAVSLRSPQMAPLFGWPELADTDGLQARWERAEEHTNVAMAHAFEALDDAERAELTALAGALHEATKG